MDREAKIMIVIGIVLFLLYSINTVGIAFLVGAIAYWAVIAYKFVMAYPINEEKHEITHKDMCNCELKL
jgi:membrane protein YdbS with pleckstrin-like domain